MNTTYTVNNKNIHLTTLMVIDGNANGKVVTHTLLRSESRENISKLLTKFIQHNSVKATKTEVVLIDKDFSEISALQETMPGVAIHLCLWHALCSMRRRLSQEKISEERQVEV